jgi:hypothetical protein
MLKRRKGSAGWQTKRRLTLSQCSSPFQDMGQCQPLHLLEQSKTDLEKLSVEGGRQWNRAPDIKSSSLATKASLWNGCISTAPESDEANPSASFQPRGIAGRRD